MTTSLLGAFRLRNRLSKALPTVALAATGLVAGASMLSGGPVMAGPIDPGLVSFDIGCNCSNKFYSGTVGWDFTVNTGTDVNFLGVYDADGDGLAAATDVGLWNRDTNTLLASVTVPQGTAARLQGQFRYSPIPSVWLDPGVHYALGALYTQPSTADWYQLRTVNNVFAPWLTYGNPTEIFGTTLQLPVNGGQAPYGIYGPNIARVPGPLPILGAGAAFGYTRRLRQRVKAKSLA